MRARSMVAGAALAALALLAGRGDTQPAGQAGAADPGARLPWDFPLPPLAYLLHPDGNPPNGKPPETKPGAAPTMAVARAAADAALAACERDGLKVGVAVLDAAGDLRVGVTSQNAAPGKVYIAIRKGLTAIEFSVPSSKVVALLNADPSQMRRMRPEMALFPGGVPLIRQGQVIGAVAASGAKAEQDEHCAAVGAASVAQRL